MALPKILENMLETAARETPLESWCIFQEKNGTIVLRLSANHDERRYKRKSSAQVRRDKERSAAWRNERSTPTHNAETVPQCSGGVSVGANAGDSQTFGVRTRSQMLHDQEEADLEQPRCADDSPAPVMDITLPSPDISSSILNPSAECFTLDISPKNSCYVPSVARWGANEL